MKKIAFTILFALIGIMSVNAQEADSLQLMELNARIDSLTTKLEKLQRDYDLSYCMYELDRLIQKIENLYRDVRISSNELKNLNQHSRFNVENYLSHKNLYDSQLGYFNKLAIDVNFTQTFINIKILNPHFTDKETEYLKRQSDSLNTVLSLAETTLQVYKENLDSYKN